VSWLHFQKVAGLEYTGSVVIQFNAGECTPSVDRALNWPVGKMRSQYKNYLALYDSQEKIHQIIKM